jgi:hypothetical protein
MSRETVSPSGDDLTVGEAFAAMTLFVNQFADRAGDDLLTLLGDISLRRATTCDPAAWQDWLACVAQVKERGLSGPQPWSDAKRI